MSAVHSSITQPVAAWIAQQQMLNVATAPLAGDGHVNVSPRGLDTLRILDPMTVAYLDLTGSGAETTAHVLENGRITLMWSAFTGPPRIVRVHGRGEAPHIITEFPGARRRLNLTVGLAPIPFVRFGALGAA